MSRNLITIAFSLLLISACYKDSEEELYPNNFVGVDNNTYSYSADIQPLIQTNCAYGACHVSGGKSPDLSTYDGLKANISRVQARAVDQKTMPVSGPMSPANISKLNKWIKDGALNN